MNCITRILLNAALNAVHYTSGPWAFTVFYVLLELIVFALEAAIFCVWMRKHARKARKGRVYVRCAPVANGASFAAGLVLVHFLPGIF